MRGVNPVLNKGKVMGIARRRGRSAIGRNEGESAVWVERCGRPWVQAVYVFSLLLMCFFFGASSASGASYQKIDGSVVNPIQSIFGGDLSGYAGPDLRSGVELEAVDLIYADLVDANLSGSTMQSVNLTGAIISGGDLTGSMLRFINLNATGLEACDLRGGDLYGATMIGASLEDAVARDADFTLVDLLGGNLRNADLRGTSFRDANLSAVDFQGSQLDGVDFRGAFFEYAVMLGDTTGSAKYDSTTDFRHAYADAGSVLFDPVAAGWLFVPEPGSESLAVFALMALGVLQRKKLYLLRSA